MAIATLKVSNEMAHHFVTGKPDVEKDIRLTMKLFELLGVAGDERELRSEYERLASLGYDGRLYPELPASITTDRLISVAEQKWRKLYRQYGDDDEEDYSSVDYEFWTPRKRAGSRTIGEFDGSLTDFSVRLALFSKEPASLHDPILHFYGLPYDKREQSENGFTQQKEVERVSRQFVIDHPDSSLSFSTCDHRHFLVWVLMDYLEKNKDDVVLSRGDMYIPTICRPINGEMEIGVARVCEKQAILGRSGDWSHYSHTGVGLSIGLNKEK